MADIFCIKHFIKSDGTERLLAAYGNDVGVFDTISTFIGQSCNLTGTKVEWVIFLNYLIGVNGEDLNLVYDIRFLSSDFFSR